MIYPVIFSIFSLQLPYSIQSLQRANIEVCDIININNYFRTKMVLTICVAEMKFSPQSDMWAGGAKYTVLVAS